jgi:nitrate/nitrite transporter NarK
MNNPSPLKKSFLGSNAYPWLVISLCAAFLFYKYVLQMSPSIMTHELMSEFNMTAFGLGNLAATFFYSYIIVQLFVGVFLDRYSPRLLTALAIAVCALGAFAFASSHYLIEAQLSRALMGCGVAFATVAYIKMTAVWFAPERAAFVNGFLATAAMLGAVFGEAPLAWLVQEIGWRDSLYFCGFLGLAIAILFYLVVRNNNPYNPERQMVKTAFTWGDVWAVLCNKQNWLLMLYGGLAFEPLAVFAGLWGPPYLKEAYSLNTTEAASLISLSFIGMAFGAPIIGWISDKINKRRIVMIAGSYIALFSFVLLIYAHLPLLWVGVLSFIFGFATGSYMLVFTLARSANKIIFIATAVAMINTGDAILGAVSEPFLGKLLDLRWSGVLQEGARYFSVQDYHIAFIILPVYLTATLVLLHFIKEQKEV